jgi:ATP-binding cassette, subfamily B, bacterial MsbA
MENGAVAAQGEVGRLLSHDGPFTRLYELQLLPGRESFEGAAE